MNIFSALIISMLNIFLINAQHKDTPVKDFNLQFSTTSIEITRGAAGKIDLTIQKSKQFQKGTVTLGTSSSLPKGAIVSFDPSTGVITSSSINISVATDAVPGTYSLVLNGTINQKTKGTIVKLIIL